MAALGILCLAGVNRHYSSRHAIYLTSRNIKLPWRAQTCPNVDV